MPWDNYDHITEEWIWLFTDFQSENDWRKAGTAYRIIVEPLDIGRTKRHLGVMAIKRLEFSRKRLHPRSSVTIPMMYNFWKSDGRSFDITSLDPTKMTQETYDMLVDIVELFASLRLHKLSLRAITRCLIALKFFLVLMVESYDSKAKIQEIKAKIQDKFNYNGNCNVKIGILPDPGGEFKVCVTPF